MTTTATMCTASLRVAIVSTAKGWHGGEEQARLLAAGLQQRGHRCTILGRAGEAFPERMRNAGFPTLEFRGRGRGPTALWQVRRFLRAEQPHVLLYNDSHALTSAGIASAGLPIPLRVASRRVDFPIRSARRYVALADRVICVSQGVADVCRVGGIPAERLAVVHDGVDPTRTALGDGERGRQSLALRPDQPLLLSVATLTDHKGHCFLLDALPRIRQEFPSVCLALAGDGELTAELQAQAARLKLGDQVRFLGFRRDIPDLLKAADLFVVPSHLEGLCSSLIDAMLVGVPAVTTTAGGLPDLVGNGPTEDGVVAWTVPPREPELLAEAICQALSDPAERRVRSQRAQLRAQRLFTADHMVEETLRVFRQELDRATSRLPRRVA